MRILATFLAAAGIAILAAPALAELKLKFTGVVQKSVKDVGKSARVDSCTYTFFVEQVGSDYFFRWENPGCKGQRASRGIDGSPWAMHFNNGGVQKISCRSRGGIRKCSDGRAFKNSARERDLTVESRNTVKLSKRSLTLSSKSKTTEVFSEDNVRDRDRTLQVQVALDGASCEVKAFKSKAVTKLRASGTAKKVKYKSGKGSGWTNTMTLRKKGTCQVISR